MLQPVDDRRHEGGAGGTGRADAGLWRSRRHTGRRVCVRWERVVSDMTGLPDQPDATPGRRLPRSSPHGRPAARPGAGVRRCRSGMAPRCSTVDGAWQRAWAERGVAGSNGNAEKVSGAWEELILAYMLDSTSETTDTTADGRRKSSQLAELKADLLPEKRALAEDLRALFGALGLSVRYALRRHLDASSVTRYLNGERVPQWKFVAELIGDVREVAAPLTPEAEKALRDTHRAALRTNRRDSEIQNLQDRLASVDEETRRIKARNGPWKKPCSTVRRPCRSPSPVVTAWRRDSTASDRRTQRTWPSGKGSGNSSRTSAATSTRRSCSYRRRLPSHGPS